jgi:TldD protein
MTDRREFLKLAGLAAAVAATDGALQGAFARTAAPAPSPMDPATRELLMEALNAAKLAGARYADVRIGRQKSNSVSTREQ